MCCVCFDDTLVHAEKSATICSAEVAIGGIFKVGGNEIDIALYTDVLRRHRTVVRVGVALTVVLTVLSFVRISPSGIGYRSPEIWSNQATFVLTQEGSPELRAVLPRGPGGSSTKLGNPFRYASLIDVYATLATSDAVVKVLLRRGLLNAKDLRGGAPPFTAAAVPSTINQPPQTMALTAKAETAGKATKLTLAATRAFLDVLHARQAAAKIQEKDRIQPLVVRSSEAPKLIRPRSKALTMLVFLGGLIATAAVAFTRDNLARRKRAPELTTVESLDELAEPELSIGANHGRSTLGSVPDVDSATVRDTPGEVAQQARRWS